MIPRNDAPAGGGAGIDMPEAVRVPEEPSEAADPRRQIQRKENRWGMNKTAVLKLIVLIVVLAAGRIGHAGPAREEAGEERLYNGIRLSQPWPPRAEDFSDDPVLPPYLAAPPLPIWIDVGRQLFVDDFLIETGTLRRTYHLPEYYAQNPVLRPDKPWESWGKGPMAIPFSDGVWFDSRDNLFKMWYYGGHGGGTTCYAVSKDGILWEKPGLDVVPGTNIVYKGARDANAVWLDHESSDPGKRFKMALYAEGRLQLFRSPDGIHWIKCADGGRTLDRSTFFYNPFRKRWVYSLKTSSRFGRSRLYWETDDFFSFSDDALKIKPAVPWAVADSADPMRADLNIRPELYNLDCAPYESLIIGLFSIWRGDYREDPQNETWAEMQKLGHPKQNAVFVGFSRDGFHWHRPDRREFFPVSNKIGAWNWGNVQSVSNGCLVVGDKLYFYVSGRAGKSFPGCGHPDAGGSTGLAFLRRDGFASMDAAEEDGFLTTRLVRFSGRFLFVNCDTAGGELRAEVVDAAGKPVPPFTMENCASVRADCTRSRVTWKGAGDLSALSGTPVRFRFLLRDGSLYSFWVSPREDGASFGYVSGGGPGFKGYRDTTGGDR